MVELVKPVKLVKELEHGTVLELAVGILLVVDIDTVLIVLVELALLVVRYSDPCEREVDLEGSRAHEQGTGMKVVVVGGAYHRPEEYA